jgi:hypothetical protein
MPKHGAEATTDAQRAETIRSASCRVADKPVGEPGSRSTPGRRHDPRHEPVVSEALSLQQPEALARVSTTSHTIDGGVRMRVQGQPRKAVLSISSPHRRASTRPDLGGGARTSEFTAAAIDAITRVAIAG